MQFKEFLPFLEFSTAQNTLPNCYFLAKFYRIFKNNNAFSMIYICHICGIEMHTPSSNTWHAIQKSIPVRCYKYQVFFVKMELPKYMVQPRKENQERDASRFFFKMTQKHATSKGEKKQKKNFQAWRDIKEKFHLMYF